MHAGTHIVRSGRGSPGGKRTFVAAPTIPLNVVSEARESQYQKSKGYQFMQPPMITKPVGVGTPNPHQMAAN